MEESHRPCASIIVAVWNKFEVTNQFLSELLPLLRDDRDEVIVVDDGSMDLTPRILEWWKNRLGDQLTVIQNSANLGFGPSSNIGAAASHGAHLIFINNDVKVHGNFILRTLDYLDRNGLAIVCGRKVDWDGGWNRFGDQIITYGEGWFMGMCRETWEVLDGFDERFIPCDYEDVDLSYRATQAGFEILEVELLVRHLGGITGGQLTSRGEITHRNRAKFAEKWGLENTPC